MNYKLDEQSRKIINRVHNITKTDYEIEDDYIPVASLIYAIDELLNEIEHLEGKLKDLEQDVEDNYKPIPMSEHLGIDNRDFYEER